MFEQCSEMTKDKMQKFDKNGTKRSNYLIINTLGSFQDQNRQAGNDYFVLFVCCFKRGTCRGLQYWRIELFSSNILVILILMCATVVSSSPAVCSFSSVWPTVFSKRRSSYLMQVIFGRLKT